MFNMYRELLTFTACRYTGKSPFLSSQFNGTPLNCCYNPKFNLNIDIRIDSRLILNDFMQNYDFKHFVDKPTRELFRRKNHSKEITLSSPLLDVILCNGNLVNSSSIIGVPFSDHKFVACCLDSIACSSKSGRLLCAPFQSKEA